MMGAEPREYRHERPDSFIPKPASWRMKIHAKI
jgi:hypothetical protein